MKTADFNFNLPKELIASKPLKQRTQSRLLSYLIDSKQILDKKVADIDEFLRPNDLLVFNNTKVIPARFFGQKSTGGKLEFLLERVLSETSFLTHIKASKAPKPGDYLELSNGTKVKMRERQGRLFHCELIDAPSIWDVLDAVGEIPLPPYMERKPEAEDSERYQTVFAKHSGAVAAPTAGLHFDDELLESLKSIGVDIGYLTLHVGSGTFQPVQVEDVSSHVMHSEWIDVSSDLVDKINAAKARRGRVIAVGTTVVRSLETAAKNGSLQAYQGDTDIFIYPGFEFKTIDGMLTNFHLPESTLLMLVSAFIGKEVAFKLYEHAVSEEYRFFSYGDAMLLI